MPVDARHNSRKLLEGPDRVVARAMMKAVGFTDESLARPQIGIAHCWIGTMPCNWNHRQLAAHAAEGVRAAGGTPIEVNTIAINDGITTGTEGMKTSLVSREIIADSVELVALGHMFDGLVTISGCDKTIPAMAMVLGRLNIPGVMLYGGSIASGRCVGQSGMFSGHKLTIQDIYEALGAYNAGKITESELKDVEEHACPGAGACGGQFTANTMATAYEMLGISAMGSNDVPAVDPLKADAARECGRLAVELVSQGVTPRSLVTRRSFENAIAGVLATGGSTNAVLHLLNVVRALETKFVGRAVTNLAVREQHGNTVTWVKAEPPDAVVFPHSTQEVSDIVKLCAAHRVPVIAFGTGTSLEGHVNAPLGGICLDLSQMKRVLAVHAEDLDCVIEPGITRKELNEHLRDQGLFFPIDPGADASIGGMVATRASGTNAVRYGTMKDCVLALMVVLPNGDIVKTAQRAKKSAAGYDLTHLFIGAEGTLGIITEITLRLHGIPEAVSAGVCQFPSVKAACDAVIATIQTGIPVARIELLDQMQVRALNLYSKLGLPESPMLLLEFHGSDASVQEQADRFGEIAAEHGCGKFEWATRPEDRTRLWRARHDAHWSVRALRPGANSISTDVCVPISRLAECVEETQRDIADMGLLAPIVGHVGDGNFHCLPLVDTNSAEEVAKVQEFIDRLVARAIAMNGTCTGEHGVGQKKMKYLETEHGTPAIELMRTLKRAIDPLNIMNPGKVVEV